MPDKRSHKKKPAENGIEPETSLVYAQGRGKIDVSPLYAEIVELVQSNWSPVAIERYLRQRYAKEVAAGTIDVPCYRTIERWRARHQHEVHVLPKRLIEEKIANLDLKIDAYAELAWMIPLLSNRVIRAMDMEEGELQGMVIGATEKAAQTLREFIQAAFQIGQQVGIYPQSTSPTFALNQLFLNRDAGRGNMSDEDFYRVIETAFRGETGEEPPTFDDGGAGTEPPPALAPGPSPE